MRRFFGGFSVAERWMITATAAIMAIGALLGIWAFAELQPIVDTTQPLFSTAWQVAASLVGAGIAARSMSRFFGMRGMGGTVRAVFGSVLGTLAFGIIAGTLILPIYGTMFAPWFVVLALVGQPVLGLLWVSGWAALQVASIKYEDERDTIFSARPSAYADPI